jgi:hypothetical protein
MGEKVMDTKNRGCTPTGAQRVAFRRRRMLIALMLLFVPSSALFASPAQASQRDGTVRCYFGDAKNVVGVWVEVSGGGSGWAGWSKLADDSQGASWSFDVPDGRSYSLHVGCGGTPRRWKSDTWTQYTTAGSADAVCTWSYGRRICALS